MIPILLRTSLGLIFNGGGFSLAYLYIKSLDKGTFSLLIIPSIGLIGVGVFLLIKASKSNASIMKEGKIQDLASENSLTEVLDKNNAIVNKWEQTSQLKDKLNVMQASAESGEPTQ